MHKANEQVRLNLMLADSAQVVGGKLFVLGGGISSSLCSVAIPLAICGTIDIPWNETNIKRTITIDLLDENRQPAMIPTSPISTGPFSISAQFEAGRPPGATKGASFTIPFAVQFIRPPLKKGRYEFLMRLDGTEVQVLTLELVEALPPVA